MERAPQERDSSNRDDSSAARASLVFGVLGGIASGKSRVARLLAELGTAGAPGVVLDADQLAREALASQPVRAKLRARFGPAALGDDGLPDREWLAEVVFRDPAARAELESWIHPIVREGLQRGLRGARERAVGRIVLDVPLLLENEEQHGLKRWCDVLVFVDSSPADREARARASRSWPAGEVARREALQRPLEEKRSLAHHVIDNRGSAQQLEDQVRRLLASLGLG